MVVEGWWIYGNVQYISSNLIYSCQNETYIDFMYIRNLTNSVDNDKE